jgi:methionine synthase II (cobalamin-independent)
LTPIGNFSILRGAVAEAVRKHECGIDIVTGGEQSKPSFNAYLVERLTGFEPVGTSEARVAARMKTDEARTFPEYYEKYFAEHMCGVGPNLALVCAGPITYKGRLSAAATALFLSSRFSLHRFTRPWCGQNLTRWRKACRSPPKQLWS